MLVTFSSPAHGDVTMFGDVALQLLKMMGRNDTVPSALYAEDVPAALDKLRAAVKPAPSSTAPNNSGDNEDDAGSVSLSNRALPLIELLAAASSENSGVMWESNK